MTTASPLQINLFKIKRLLLPVTIFISVLFNLINHAYANEQKQSLQDEKTITTSFIARSIGQQTMEKTTNPLPVNQQKTFATTQGITRTEHLLQKKTAKKSKQNHLNNNNSSAEIYSVNFQHFSIYRAFSYLLEDIDGDDFYRSFSIVFDADVDYSGPADIYAELYLRRDGGPWIHYYASDIFTIYGDNEEDEFEVNTTLEQGFIDGFYDVLIDLYDAHSDELVVSYGSDDSNALYALPLESSDYDPEYITEVEVIFSDGGSISLLMLVILFALFLSRHKKLLIKDIIEKIRVKSAKTIE